MLRDALRELLDDVMPSARIRALGEHPDTRDAWRAVAQGGWLGIADAYRDSESTLGLIHAAEEFGSHLFPGPFSLVATLVSPLLTAADHPRNDDVLTGATVASIVLPTMTPDEMPLWRWPDVRGTRTPSGIRLDGSARSVPFATSADVVLVPFEEDGGGVSVAVARHPSPGVVVTPSPVLDVTRPAARVQFESVILSEEDVIGPDVRASLDRGLALYLLALNAEGTGAAEQVLRSTVEYVSSRHQFGVPVGSFQAIKHALADSSVDLELARTRTYHLAWELGQADDVDIAAVASARLIAALAYRRICERALQCHGGVSFTSEQGLDLWYRNALAAESHLAEPAALRSAVLARLLPAR